MRGWLKDLRKENRITQLEMAKALGMNQQTYSMIERGERQKELSLLLAAKISSVLKTSLSYIIAMEAEKSCPRYELGAAREFIQEDGNGICDQTGESVSNMF